MPHSIYESGIPKTRKHVGKNTTCPRKFLCIPIELNRSLNDLLKMRMIYFTETAHNGSPNLIDHLKTPINLFHVIFLANYDNLILLIMAWCFSMISFTCVLLLLIKNFHTPIMCLDSSTVRILIT